MASNFRGLICIALGSALVMSFVACGTDTSGSGAQPSDDDAGTIDKTDAGSTDKTDSGTTDAASTSVTLGGTVTGLVGDGLVLANGASTVSVAKAAATFAFPQKLSSGDAYDVKVKAQPSSPSQTCTVSKGTGTASADVSDVSVACTTNTYSISVHVVGASSDGLVLQNNGGDDLVVPASPNPQTATFATKVESGKPFAVTIQSQPKNPNELCTIAGGSGTVVAGDVSSITVNCAPSYVVSGTVAGLSGAGLVLQNNGGDDVPVNANGTFAFPTPLLTGAAYSVSVKTGSQPQNPWQTCTVTAGDGTIASADVSSVKVDCATNPYNVSVAVSGLKGTGLTFQNNGGDDLAVAADGTSTFKTSVLSGAPYDVKVSAQPTSPWQTCSVTNGTGTMKDTDVTLTATCTTDQHTVGGNVVGLKGTGLVVKINGVALPAINTNGAFTGPALDSGTAYTVTLDTAPSNPTQKCRIFNDTGTVTGADVTNVVVNCENKLLLVEASPFASDVKTQLTASNAFDAVDDFDANTGTPTFAQLQPYTAVLVFSDGKNFQSGAALGNVLADYFDAGGHVVPATFSNVGSLALGGRWISDNYHLIAISGQTQPSSTGAITIVDATSPLVTGVTKLTATAAYQSTGDVINGGTAIARWGTGGVLIAAGTKNGRKHAELNMYPPSSAIRSDFWVGDGVPIMVNALTYE